MSMNFEKLANKYMDDIIKTAQELIQIKSLSLEEEAIAKYIKEKMESLGYDKVEVDDYGSVFGTITGTGEGSSLLMNCHMDVVHEGDVSKWEYPPYGAVVSNGKIYGRGASDTKGTMAIQLYAPIILKEAGFCPKGDIVTACVVAEENAGFGSMIHTRENRYITDYAILGEATENNLVIGNRGRFCVVIKIHGKSCHASIPENGKNPFDYVEKLLPLLKTVEMGKDDLFGQSTMALTKIESSEIGTNLVPNSITLYVDYRAVPVDTEEVVLSKFQNILDKCALDEFSTEISTLYFPLKTYTGKESVGFQGEYPYSIDPESDIVKICKETLEKHTGREIKVYPWAFATDAGHYAAKGVKCIGYSPAEIIYCHTTNDNIDLKMMEEGTIGYLALIEAITNISKNSL